MRAAVKASCPPTRDESGYVPAAHDNNQEQVDISRGLQAAEPAGTPIRIDVWYHAPSSTSGKARCARGGTRKFWRRVTRKKALIPLSFAVRPACWTRSLASMASRLW